MGTACNVTILDACDTKLPLSPTVPGHHSAAPDCGAQLLWFAEVLARVGARTLAISNDSHSHRHTFTFDHIAGPIATQADVFEGIKMYVM